MCRGVLGYAGWSGSGCPRGRHGRDHCRHRLDDGANQVAADFRVKTQNLPRATQAERIAAQRIGQDMFRAALPDYWQGSCCVTGLAEPSLLTASHIKPVSFSAKPPAIGWCQSCCKTSVTSFHTGELTSEHGLDMASRGNSPGACTNWEPWPRAGVPYRATDRYSAWAEKAPTVSSTSPRAMPTCLARLSHPSTAEATSSTICLPRSSVSP